MEYKDYYKVLGVARDSTREEIKRAYRRLARKYHPDVSKEPDAEVRIKEVNEAYEALKDPEKRAAYDRLGTGWQAGQEFKPPPDWDTVFQFGGGGFTGTDARQFSDFFESLFGGGFAGLSGAPGGRGNFHLHVHGVDQHAKIRISLEEAYHGVTRALSLSEAQRGTTVKPHHLQVKIPAGISHGQQIRLTGQGAPGTGGGSPGDLYLEIDIQPHPLYRTQKKDIYLNLSITPWEAALGAKIAVPTLGGKVDVKIPAGAQSGQKLRLKGRGLPGKTPGDQYMILQIKTPQPKTASDRKLYQDMAREMPYNPRAHLED